MSERKDKGGGEELFAPAPYPRALWGSLGALAGIGVLALSWIALTIAVVLVARGLGADLESFGVKWSVLLGSQALLIAIAWGAAWVFKSWPEGVGLTSPRWPTLALSALAGLVTAALVEGYVRLLALVWPAGYEAMLEEVARQRALVEAPFALVFFAVVILAPFAEELFFRGFVYAGLRNGMNVPNAAGISAVVFGAFHVMPWSFVPLVIVGLMAAWVYERTRSLWAPIVLHAVFNLLALLLYQP